MAYALGNMCAEIFVNGQFYFNLSSKTWSHVFETQCRMVGYLVVKTFEDTFILSERIHERDGRTE